MSKKRSDLDSNEMPFYPSQTPLEKSVIDMVQLVRAKKRESYAAAALTGLLSTLGNPLFLDDNLQNQIVAIAWQLALKMESGPLIEQPQAQEQTK